MRYQKDGLKKITLEREVPALERASELTIQKLGLQDLEAFKELIDIFKESDTGQSKKEIDEFSLNTMLRRIGFTAFIALENNKIIGGITTYDIWSYYKGESVVFLYNLAVKPANQRKGIGKLLMKAVLDFSKEKGHSKVYIEAPAEDQCAIEFYRNTGAMEYQVSKFVYEL